LFFPLASGNVSEQIREGDGAPLLPHDPSCGSDASLAGLLKVAAAGILVYMVLFDILAEAFTKPRVESRARAQPVRWSAPLRPMAQWCSAASNATAGGSNPHTVSHQRKKTWKCPKQKKTKERE
jgi:uncharacterized protein (DUF2237 family)